MNVSEKWFFLKTSFLPSREDMNTNMSVIEFANLLIQKGWDGKSFAFNAIHDSNNHLVLQGYGIQFNFEKFSEIQDLVLKTLSKKPECTIISSSRSSSGQLKLTKPRPIKIGDTIGIFTPSWPAHVIIRDKYLHAIEELRRIGFSCKEGFLTSKVASQGYRSSSPQERAKEFMELILDPDVHCLMSSIGGSNSASMIPYLDFDKIRESRKLICGYSDTTSLHLSILAYSGLSTMYGLALVPSFGEFPRIMNESLECFLRLTQNTNIKKFRLNPPKFWSNHFIDATDSQWRTIKRELILNEGWLPLSMGKVQAQVVVANLETLLSSAGTSYFPILEGKILILDETAVMFSKTERNYRQLERIGVFDQISGLIISKPGEINSEGAPFTFKDLVYEIIGDRSYPIIMNFDCGHTFPMISLPECGIMSIDCNDCNVSIYLEDSLVSN